MLLLIANSKTRVHLTGSTWGYHVARQGHVLAFIKSQGNDRAEADTALSLYEHISTLYQRLFDSMPRPSELTINTLAWIIAKPSPDIYGIPLLNRNSFNALL